MPTPRSASRPPRSDRSTKAASPSAGPAPPPETSLRSRPPKAGHGSWKRSSGPKLDRPPQAPRTTGTADRTPSAPSTAALTEPHRTPAAASPAAASPVRSMAGRSSYKAPQNHHTDRPAPRSQPHGSPAADDRPAPVPPNLHS